MRVLGAEGSEPLTEPSFLLLRVSVRVLSFGISLGELEMKRKLLSLK